MTSTEFSNQFDVLYNNITSNQAPGLNEYEKSVFLTKAQDEIVKNYFSPKGNLKQDGFDDSPKRQADFSILISSASLPLSSGGTFDPRETTKTSTFPSDLFLMLNEQMTDGTIPITVVPISYEEYDRLMAKPYKYPPKYQAWRLITNKTAPSGGSSVPGFASKDLGMYSGYEGQKISFKNNTDKPINLIVKKRSTTPGQDPDDSYVVDNTGASTIITYIVPPTIPLGTYYTEVVEDSTAKSYLSDLVWPSGDTVVQFNALPTIICNITADKKSYNSGASSPVVELIGRFNHVPSYRIRYIRRAKPIILINLDQANTGLSIHGESVPQEPVCELAEELHEEILQRAVELAKVAWTSNGQDNVQLVMEAGKRSE